MNFREFSQIEVWSKRTSRKLIVGLLLILIGLFIAYWVETNWLTASERNAGNVALKHIDGLQDAENVSFETFKLNEKQASVDVEQAENAGWTLRDNSIARLLSVYLMLSHVDRTDRELRAKYPGMIEKAEQEQDPQLVQSSKVMRDLLRSELHACLR